MWSGSGSGLGIAAWGGSQLPHPPPRVRILNSEWHVAPWGSSVLPWTGSAESPPGLVVGGGFVSSRIGCKCVVWGPQDWL